MEKIADINVNCNNSIKLSGSKIIYIDPFRIEEKINDADYIFCTHSHYDHFSKEDILKIKKENTKIITVKSSKEDAEQLIKHAQEVEAAGAVMLVLEAIPSDLAEVISEKLTIPVIGIGAGKGTDGQVLVYHDLLNYGSEHVAKFVKQYGNFSTGVDALNNYHKEVKSGAFPSEEFTYKKKVMGETGK